MYTPTNVFINIITRFILWTITFIFAVFAIQAKAQKPENRLPEKDNYLLIINTYTSDAPWSNAIINPVQRWAVAEEHIDVYVEHMNMLMINDISTFGEEKTALFRKYASHTPKAILLLGSSVLMLKDDIRSQWGDIPLVLCAETDFTGPETYYIEKRPIPEQERTPISELANPCNLTFVQSKLFLSDNIKLLKRMIPELKKIVLIGDTRYINQQINYDIGKLIAQNYKSLSYEFYSAGDMTMAELLDSLNQIDMTTTGVLFSSWFSKTQYAGNTMLSASAFREISNTIAPVFSLKQSVMENTGMIGGYFYDMIQFQKELQHKLAQVVAGIPARDVPFYIPSEAIPTFNYPALLQKGFTPEICPPGSIFIDRPLTYWDRNKYALAFGGSLVILSLLFLFLYQRYRIRILNALNEERQQKLEAIQEMARLFDDMPVSYMKGQFIRDASGVVADVEIIRMNKRFIHGFIANENELEGRKASELFGPDYVAFLRFVRLFDTEQKAITYSQFFSSMDKFLDIVITPASRPDCMNMYCINATDLHKAQQKLDETNRKLAMSLDVANIVPWNWDLREHKILCDVNRPVKLVMEQPGIDEEKLAVPESQYFSKIHKEDRERIEQAFRNLVEGRIDKIREEYRVVTRNASGHRMDWVEARAAVENRDDQGQPLTLVGSSLVITQRKEMERELIDARDKAEESNRLKSAFLANMSHEIRTPLNAIVGFSSLMKSVDETQEREEYMRIIESNNDLLLQLVGDILDLSKIEAGTLEIVESVFEVGTMLTDTTKALQLRADSKRLTVRLGDYPEKCFIRTDRNRLNQVLTNLVTNAIKFTDEGGEISIGCKLLQNKMLRFYVKDTGCGIPPEKQQEIFTRFVKLNSFVQGTGLGLPICQTIINKLGGDIGVDSMPGKGSTFWFTLPYQKAQQADDAIHVRPLVPVRHDEITILIAEDNISNFQLFETILKKDYRILHAHNGQEAVEMFSEHHPHIVLMDICMPVMDGYEAITEIRKVSANVPVLAVTAYAYASDEQRIMNFGFDGYTSKPINANVLRSKIKELIGNRLLLF